MNTTTPALSSTSLETRVPLPLLLGFVLAGWVVLVYSGTLGADFVWGDDKINIYENPNIRNLDWGGIQWMFTNQEYARRYMPLGWLSWAVNYGVSGLNPFGFHLGNVIFHMANTALVFFFIFTLLSHRRNDDAPSTRVRWVCAALAAAWWAVHPMRVEPVAWASGRIYCQATFFVLVSWIAYWKWKCPGEARRRRFHLGLAVAAYAASLLTYPIALGGLVVFFLLDWYQGQGAPERSPSDGEPTRWRLPFTWMDKVPFALAALFVFGMTVWARVETTEYVAPPTLEEFPVVDRVMQAGYMWAYYMWKPWWPTDLSPYYLNLVEFDPFSWKFVASLVAVTGISAVLLIRARSKKGLLFLWIAYLALLAPMLGLTERPHHPNDRYNYIADIGYGILIAAGLFWAWSRVRWRRPVAGIAVGLVLVCSWMSLQQTARWRDTVAHYEYVLPPLEGSPLHPVVLLGLGVFFQEQNELEKARQIYREVLRIDPEEAHGHSNLADVLFDLGQVREAEAHYREALRIRPNYLNPRLNLGVALAQQGRLEEARQEMERLLLSYPSNAQVHYNLSLMLKELGHVEEADQHRREALRLERGEPPALTPIANRP